jgi:hypothetical protein
MASVETRFEGVCRLCGAPAFLWVFPHEWPRWESTLECCSCGMREDRLRNAAAMAASEAASALRRGRRLQATNWGLGIEN